MGLLDRVQTSEQGFKLWPAEEEGRKAYFGIFHLKDDPGAVPELRETEYWDLKNSFEQEVEQPGSFIYLEERVGEEVLESCRFYWAGGKPKQVLNWYFQYKKKYGSNAHIITLEWAGPGEAIHRSYIYMLDRQGRKYPFITKTIGSAGSSKEQFVTILPDNDVIENYRLGFDRLLLQKYETRQIGG